MHGNVLEKRRLELRRKSTVWRSIKKIIKEKIKMKEMRVRLTFLEEVLGTANAERDIHEKFIASKAPDAPSREQEVEALGIEEVIEKGRTVFPKDENGNPFLWDYQIRGFFKSAAQAGSYMGGAKKLAAYKKKIDLLVFVNERKIPFVLPEGTTLSDCQRPLRAQTAQGERISLADSETVPAGSTVEFTIRVLDDSLMKYVIDWLDYGRYNGIGQWRNSGKGRYTWTEITE